MLNSISNEEITWQSLKGGDRNSFEKIYQAYFDNLYEYGMRLVNSNEIVEDCIHDLFVKIWMNKSNLGNVTNVRAYLMVSLRGSIYNSRKAKKTTLSIGQINEAYFKLDFTAENALIIKDEFAAQRIKLVQAMNGLSAKQKEIIYLRYFEELGYDEIAVVMQISVKATYKLSARALEALRQILKISNISLIILLSLPHGSPLTKSG